MRSLAPLLIATLVLTPVSARPTSPHASASASVAARAEAPASAASAGPRLVEPGTYRNVDGVVVHAPTHTDDGTAPAGASAQCRDGNWSFSLHHRGTCSHHGGVARWL